MDKDTFFDLVEFSHLAAELIGNEGGAVEGDVVAVLLFAASYVCILSGSYSPFLYVRF